MTGQGRQSNSLFSSEVGAMQLTDESTLITGEGKKVRLWDLRKSLDSPSIEFKVSDWKQADLFEKWHRQKAVTTCIKLRYLPLHNTICANFSGGNGIFTFDMRKCIPRDYYNYHYYPSTDFDVGIPFMSHLVVSCGTTHQLQQELRVSDIRKSKKKQDVDHTIIPGHKANVVKVLMENDKIITGSKDGSVLVS